MYLKHKVNVNPSGMQAMVDDLEGYFACGIITRDESNRRVIDVFKSRASLYGGYVEGIGFVITTNENDLKDVCKELGLNLVGLYQVTEDRHMRLDALTGECLFVNSYRDTANQTKTTTVDFQRRSLPQYTSAHGSFNSSGTQGTQANDEERAGKLNLADAVLDGWDYNFQTHTWSRVS